VISARELERSVVDELTLRFVQLVAVGRTETTLDRVRTAVNVLVDFADDVGKLDTGYRGVDLELVCVLDRLHDIGVVQQHLRRDTAAIEAGAAESPLLDDRDRLSLVRCGVRHVEAGAGADDEKVVLLHTG